MNKQDLALNNQQWLICDITKPNQLFCGELLPSKQGMQSLYSTPYQHSGRVPNWN